ncbi:MAG: methyltransferase [Thermodesulfobacteriota bacterium]
MISYLAVLLSLIGFGAFHIISADETFRSRTLNLTRTSNRIYVGIRAFISLGLLMISILLLFRLAQDTPPLFYPLRGIPAIIPSLIAIWMAGSALRQVAVAGRILQFFGLQENPKLFIFSGIYTFCRHPMYSGWLFASWGLILSKPFILTLFYNLLLTVIVIFMALQEEKRMIRLFGGKYLAYRRQVPFLLPYGILKKRE